MVTRDQEAGAIEAPLRRWRRAKGLRLRECADLTGMSVAYLSELERGHAVAPAMTRVKIARRLGARISDLFDPEPIDDADGQAPVAQLGE